MKKTLFIRGGALGDFILTLPALESVRAACPEGRVEILGYPSIAALAVGPGRPADAARWVGDAAFAPLFCRGGNLGPSEADYLASFDAVVCVWPDAEGTIRRNLERHARGAITMLDPFPRSCHAADFVLAQAEEAGWPVAIRMPRVAVDAASRQWARQWMRQMGLRRPLLVSHPGSGSVRKNWPAERFAALGRMWAASTGGGAALTCGPADEEQAAAVLAAWSGPAPPVLREENLLRVAALLEGCDAYLGNDSGVSHLAAAVGAPAVALFGPTDPRLWGPRGPKALAVPNAMAMEPGAVMGFIKKTCS